MTTIINKMDKEQTINIMASCDFSTPMTVTIMLEDSEDEMETKSEYSFHECATPKIYSDNNMRFMSNIEEQRYNNKESIPAHSNRETEIILNRGNNIINNNKHTQQRFAKKRKKDETADIHVSKELCVPQSSTISECTAIVASSVNSTIENKKDNEHIENIESTNIATPKIDELNTVVNDLLVKVSESLIYIWKAYRMHILNVSDKSNGVKFLQESKKRYLRIKNYFYQLSYFTSTTLLLSRENDPQFVENFINYTVSVAENKNILLSAQEIKPLFYEMIAWVKQNKEKRNLPLSALVNPTKTNVTEPVLRHHLSQPTMKTDFQNPLVNSRPRLYNTDTNNIEIKMTPHYEQNRQILLYSDLLQPPISRERSEILNPLRSQRLPVIQKNDQSKYNFVPAQNQNKASKTNFMQSINTNGHHPHTAYEKQSFAWCNQMHCIHPTFEQLPQRNSHSLAPPNYEPIRDAEEFVELNPQTNFESSRSSVSTDSGIISPPQFYSTINNVIGEGTSSEQLTPLITDVTSLNPKALPMAEGVCHVCSIRTKKRCLGCYQVYYCSYNCQKSDWSIHMNQCAQRRA